MNESKVLHVIQSSLGGGAEAVASLIAKHQLEHFTVGILTWEDKTGAGVPEGVWHYKVAKPHSGFIGLIKLSIGIRKVLRTEKVDYIIAHMPYSAIAVYLASVNLEISTKVFVHHSSSAEKPLGLPSRVVKRIYKAFKVVAVSEDGARSLSNFTDFNTVTVLPNPIVLAGKRKLRKKPIKGAPLRLIAVGRLAEVKNYRYMFEALSKLDFEFELNVIGDGDLERFMQVAVDFGIHTKTYFRGWLDKADILDFFEISDIFIMTSNYEGEPSSLLEAAAIGLPILGRPTPGLGKAVIKVGGVLPVVDTTEAFADALTTMNNNLNDYAPDRSWIFRHDPSLASHAYCKLIFDSP